MRLPLTHYSTLEAQHATALSIPAGVLTVTIRANILERDVFQNTGWSTRYMELLKHAIVDTFAHEDYSDEPEGFKGIVEAFSDFVVIKNRIYKHSYVPELFEQDLQTAECMKFRNRAITVIKLVPAEIITINQPENFN